VTTETAGMQTPEALGSFEGADRQLRRTMGFNSLLFMSMGAIIGSGWLLAALASASVAGPASIISWIIGGVFVLFVAITYAELSGMLPRTGAVVRYPNLTHGSYTGWIIGWTYWLSAISVPAIEAEAVVTYVSGTYPSAGFTTISHTKTVLTGAGIGFAVGLMLFFFLLNVAGIRLLGETNRIVTWWKILLPTATFCFLFLAFNSKNVTGLHGGFMAQGTGSMFVAISSTGIIFSYLGFRQALDYAGESRAGARHAPWATIVSVLIGIAIYTLLQVGFVGALHWGAARVHVGDWAGLATSPWATRPLYDALQAAGVTGFVIFGQMLLVDAGISPSGTGWIYLGTAARTNYGLGIHGYGPKALTRHNRFGIPWVSLVVALVVGCVFFVPAPSWYTLVGFITSTTALTYIMGGVGLPVFRKYAPTLARPFRLRGHWVWSLLGFLGAMMIVFFTPFVGGTLPNVYGAVFVGLPLFAWWYAIQKGWARPIPSLALGAIFLGAWVYICLEGGWVLRVAPPAATRWSFGTYDIALSAAVIFFCVGMWWICNAEGRRHISSSAWLIVMILAIFPVNYATASVGAESATPTGFTFTFAEGTLLAVGIGVVAFFWGVFSGMRTPELDDIVARSATTPPAAEVPPAAAA
jgi:amino acid transporter